MLFVANRGHDSIALFRVTEAGPVLERHVQVGSGPRNLSITPDGALLLVGVLRADVVRAYRLDADGDIIAPMATLAVPRPAGC